MTIQRKAYEQGCAIATTLFNNSLEISCHSVELQVPRWGHDYWTVTMVCRPEVHWRMMSSASSPVSLYLSPSLSLSSRYLSFSVPNAVIIEVGSSLALALAAGPSDHVAGPPLPSPSSIHPSLPSSCPVFPSSFWSGIALIDVREPNITTLASLQSPLYSWWLQSCHRAGSNTLTPGLIHIL